MPTVLKPHDKDYRLAYDKLPDGTIISTGMIRPSEDLPYSYGSLYRTPPDFRIYDTRVWEIGSDEVEIYRYSDKSQALRNHDRLVDFHHPDFQAHTEEMLKEAQARETNRWEAIIEELPNGTEPGTDEHPNRKDDTKSKGRSPSQKAD
jgi:hypothetical protein